MPCVAKGVIDMAGMLRVPRTRGALSGVLLVLLGLWGGLIPFVGSYFHFSYTPGTAWTYTSGRLWLEILPAAGTVVGGLILLASRVRPVAMFGAWVAAASGAWFAVGRALSPLWQAGGALDIGSPIGSTVTRVLVEISYFSGLGVIIVFLAALSTGRLTVIGVRDARRREVVPAGETTAGPATEPVAVQDAGTTTGLPRRRAVVDGSTADGTPVAEEDTAVSGTPGRPVS